MNLEVDDKYENDYDNEVIWDEYAEQYGLVKVEVNKERNGLDRVNEKQNNSD